MNPDRRIGRKPALRIFLLAYYIAGIAVGVLFFVWIAHMALSLMGV